MKFSEELLSLAKEIHAENQIHNKIISCAESCTGGMVASYITSIPGSSLYFDRGFVTYSNLSKIDLLSVNPSTLAKYGAVSGETASEMVAGCLAHSDADIAVAITGIAGPDGGTKDKPVGTVYVASQITGHLPTISAHHYQGNRDEIRNAACISAMQMLLELIKVSI